MVHIRACQPEDPTMPTSEREKSKKLTEPMRSEALKWVDGKLTPSVLKDGELSGFALHVTISRAFWALTYQPRGINPATGKRWGGGVRHELGDAMVMTADEARAAAYLAKGLVRQGRSPHHAAMASRASAEAARAIVPQTVGEILDIYDRALMARREPSEWTRKQSVRYARLAVTYMNVGAQPISSISTSMVRLLIEQTPGSGAQRQHVYGSLNRFMTWARKQGLIEVNPCSDLDRADRPRPSKARDHVPSLVTLRAIWRAVEDEPQSDLIRFMLLVPLRRNEAGGLAWREVDFVQGRIRIAAHRMKAREAHELPLSPPARAILEARKLIATGDLVFPSANGTPHMNWDKLLTRIRARIGEDKSAKDDRFSLHDLRRAFVSHLAEDFDVDALDQVLAHKRTGVAAIYQRSKRWPERVRALNAWADLILNVEADSNVVPIQAARKVV
jgi:integrase